MTMTEETQGSDKGETKEGKRETTRRNTRKKKKKKEKQRLQCVSRSTKHAIEPK
jgi:hypothetical protein